MNIGKLIEYLQKLPPETSCSYDLWLPDDVREYMSMYLPEEGDGAITDEEVAETLATVYHRRDAERGTTWATIQECLPDSVQDRM